MELRHLRYFVTVAEERHFGRAAARLYMAQPPLSQSIRQLETEIGVPLFERTSRRVSLTAAGSAFFREAQQILADVNTAVIVAQRTHKGDAGWLGIGFSASATYDILPDVLRGFRERYPDVELMLYELNAAEQAAALHEATIHLGFARPSIDEPGIVRETIAQEPFVVALPETHPLARNAEIFLAALAVEAFILFPRVPKPSYADSILALCAEAGFIPRVAQEVREMQTAVSLVSAGMGVTLVPAPVQNLRRAGVVYRPLAGPARRTELTVAFREDDTSPILQNFLLLLRHR